jgi:hypothetical protein
MGFWERLIGVGPSEGKDSRRLLPELLANYHEEVRLARQIREHADLAPNQAGAQTLRMAADEQDRIVQLLHDKVVAVGGEVNGAIGPTKGGKNHWARVVHDLEDNQALRQRYNEQARHWDPDFPDIVTLLRALEQEKTRLNALLRDIALRADPHALD